MGILRGFLSFFLCSLLVLCLFILGIITTISLTILNPEFVTSELDKFDIYSVVIDKFTAQLPIEGAQEAIDTIITDLKPWLKEQTNTAIYAGYAYLKGNRELNIVIPLESLKLSLKQNLRQYAISSLPPELAGLPEDVIETYLSQAYDKIDTLIPKQFEITETSLGKETMAVLEQAKQIVSYIKLTYVAAVVLAILMVLFIAMVHRWRTKPLARSIGISFITVGITTAIMVIISRAGDTIANLLPINNELIPGLQEKLAQLVTEVTAPLLIYGIAFLITGIILIIISVLVKSPEYNKIAR